MTQTLSNNQHALYSTWAAMWQRCTNPNRVEWERYGGRGISVFSGWKAFESFAAYIEAELGPKPAGMSLDRWPDCNGDYEPGNVRWATKMEQAHNTDRCLANFLEFEGEMLARAEVARRLGISHSGLRHRIEDWPEEHWFKPAGFRYVPRDKSHQRIAQTFRLKIEEQGQECIATLASQAGLPVRTVYGRKHRGWPRELWLKPLGFQPRKPATYQFEGEELTTKEIAERTGKSINTITRWVRQGRLFTVTGGSPPASILE